MSRLTAPLNLGMLDGFLQVMATGHLTAGPSAAPAALCVVQTDTAENGGCHRVLFTDALAASLVAYWQARGAAPQLEVTVHGWLHSLPDAPSVLMAERLRVHNVQAVRPLPFTAPAFHAPLALGVS